MSQTLEAGTLYDVNKDLMKKENPLSPFAFREKLRKVSLVMYNKGQYYMLLCHERRDYTLFNLQNCPSQKAIQDDLRDCFINRGEVLSIDKTEDNQAFEIWINIDEAFCYYLFSYDEGVIDYVNEV